MTVIFCFKKLQENLFLLNLFPRIMRQQLGERSWISFTRARHKVSGLLYMDLVCDSPLKILLNLAEASFIHYGHLIIFLRKKPDFISFKVFYMVKHWGYACVCTCVWGREKGLCIYVVHSLTGWLTRNWQLLDVNVCGKLFPAMIGPVDVCMRLYDCTNS